MRRNKTTPSVELTAQLVEPLAPSASDPVSRSYQAAAAALSPAVFPSEQFRKDTKDMILREMKRPKGITRLDAGSLDGDNEPAVRNVLAVDTGASSITFADMELIDQDRAANAAEAIARIVARHESTSRHHL